VKTTFGGSLEVGKTRCHTVPTRPLTTRVSHSVVYRTKPNRAFAINVVGSSA